MKLWEQWPLLEARGFGDLFAGTWIEGDDPDEIARLLGGDPAAAVPCGLAEAMRHYEPYGFDELVWMGAHAPGWIHAITVAGPRLRTEPLAGRRYVQVVWDADGLGVHDLYYSDGVTEGRLSPRDVAVTGWPFHEHAHGLADDRMSPFNVFAWQEVRPDGVLRLWLDNWLIVAGRLSGRFLDDDCLDATRRLYRLPVG
ncbi:hypothetical protein [Nonomuraea sp. NPDC049725]|uniref:hypothetical protein n=1 Tax=Nonomuraea sp. NPDC049725 TaxID=3154508 RepID=UPI0034443E5B